MISASFAGLGALARKLEQVAKNRAEARTESNAREASRDPWRWRDARLLWPDRSQEP